MFHVMPSQVSSILQTFPLSTPAITQLMPDLSHSNMCMHDTHNNYCFPSLNNAAAQTSPHPAGHGIILSTFPAYFPDRKFLYYISFWLFSQATQENG